MRTPLFETHAALGAKMAPFAGWDMPIQYEGILAEHHQTRTGCSIFDTCHMGEFELRGASAPADLERLLTMSVGTLKDGQCRYGYLLREDGGVLDDLTCYRWGPEHYWLIVNAGTLGRDRDWVWSHLSPGTDFSDLSGDTAKLDVQGPSAREVVERAFDTVLPSLGYFRFATITLDGIPCVLSRTGYTGEWGYELYFPARSAVRFWELLVQRGGARPAGLGARDTLRLEMGYPLYGHELTEDRTPVACARGAFIDASKPFVGVEAVRRDLEGGCSRYLCGLRLETKRAARAGDRVLSGGSEVGIVTSGSLAPSLGVAVAMAYVDEPFTRPGTALEIDVHGRPLPATVVGLPFHHTGTARAKTTPA